MMDAELVAMFLCTRKYLYQTGWSPVSLTTVTRFLPVSQSQTGKQLQGVQNSYGKSHSRYVET